MAELKKFFLIICVMLFACMPSFCAPLKIHDLLFDDSDNIVIFKTVSEFSGEIKKGALTSPDRIYFDIPNSVLTTPSKTWKMKNSTLDEVKISQFSLNPDIVRVVLKPNKKIELADTDIIVKNNSLILKYSSSKLAENGYFETIFRNFEDKESLLFEPTKVELEVEPIKQVSLNSPTTDNSELAKIFSKMIAKKLDREYKLNSKFYASKVTNTTSGLMLSGIGSINLKQTIFLDNPKRLVFDIPNAVLAQNLRNKTFLFTQSGPQTPEQLEARDILRLGQFDKNTLRIVIQGEGAKDYRVVVSPDLQNLFITKRQNVLGVKLTQNLSYVNNYSFEQLDKTLSILNINLSAPTAFSSFEEGGYFHLDMQNVANYNLENFNKLAQNPSLMGIKAIKIATDKTRISIPIKNNINVNAQISQDGKSFKIYFKELEKPVEPPKLIITSKKDDTIIIQKEKIKPAIISNYFKVTLDAGHGGNDCGAIRNGINEKDINLDVAKLVREGLEKQKVKVTMTRNNDKYLSLAERVEFAENKEPDIFVSIHVNASVKEDIVGIETHWWREESVELAKKIHTSMASEKNLKKWNTKDRGLFKSQFYVINHTTMPAVLLEIGFMSNDDELKELTKKEHQEELSKAIVDGIMKYLKSRGK